LRLLRSSSEAKVEEGGDGGERGAWVALSNGLPVLVEMGSMCKQDTSSWRRWVQRFLFSQFLFV
jgi:hypothetical protein